MRNLKRALSLALALVMVLSMMVVGAGAVSVDDFSDGADIVNKEAVTVLATLNVINGKEDGSYDPTGTITRGEMAKMICVILNGGNDPVLGETVADSYSDTASHWAKAYIEYCTTLGIVAGKGDGTFDPKGQVTVAEAGKMVLVALGYNAGVEGYTGGNWQINTDVRANALGLYDDLDYTNTSAALTRDNAAQMLYNALDCNMVFYDYIITGTVDNAITTKPQLNDWDMGTLLWEKFKAVKLEGVVVANEYAVLDSTRKDNAKAPNGDVIGAHLDEGKTEILITNYDANSEQSIFRNQEYTFNVSTGENELAKTVYVYVKPYNTTSDNANRATVIGSANISEDNTIITDASGDSVVDVADDNNLDLIEGETQYVYNYSGLADLDLTDLPAVNGKVGIEKTLIDTDADGDVNYVLYKEMGLGKVTTYTEAKDGRIVVAVDENSYINDDKADVVGFDDVEKDAYVLTAYIGGRLYVQNAETVTGTIEAYKQTKDASDDSGYRNTAFTVDGTAYNVSRVFTYDGDIYAAVDGVDKTILSSEATFYLDLNGNVIAYGEVAETAYKYAYIWGAEAGTTNLDSDRVKATLEDGSTKTYTLADNSDIDIVVSGGDNYAKVDQNLMQGRVYAYSLTSGGELRLRLPTGGAVESDTANSHPVFTKGLTNIQFTAGNKVMDGLTYEDLRDTPDAKNNNLKVSDAYYSNNATTFFYVTYEKDADGNIVEDPSTGNSVIDSVDVYNGRNNAPTVEGVAGTAILGLNSRGRVAAAAFNGVEVAESAGDHVFIFDAGFVFEDIGQVGAIFNGASEAEDNVPVAFVDYLGGDIEHNPTVEDGIYLYRHNSDGYYEIADPGHGYRTNARVDEKPYYFEGVVAQTDKLENTFVLLNSDGSFYREFHLTSNSLVVDYDADNSAPNIDIGGTVEVGNEVQIIVNNDQDMDVLMVAIMDRTDVESGVEIPTETRITINGDYTIDVFNPADASVADILNAVAVRLQAEGYTDVTVTSSNANAALGAQYGEIKAKNGIVTETFTVYHSARVDVNGTTKGYYHGNVDLNSSTNMIAVIDDGTTYVYKKAGTPTVAINGDYTFNTADANKYDVITLVDAAQVTLVDAKATLADDTTKDVDTLDYIAEGTKIIVTGDTRGAGNVITATVNGKVVATGEVSADRGYATLTYTVEADTTLAEAQGYMVYAGDDVTVTYTDENGNTKTLNPGQSGFVTATNATSVTVRTTAADAVILVENAEDITSSYGMTGTQTAQTLAATNSTTSTAYYYAASGIKLDSNTMEYFKVDEELDLTTDLTNDLAASAYKVGTEAAVPATTLYKVETSDVTITSYNTLSAAGTSGNGLTVAVKGVTSSSGSNIESAGTDTWYIDASYTDVVVEYTVDGTEAGTASKATEITVTNGGTLVQVGSSVSVSSNVATVNDGVTVSAASDGFKTGNLDLSAGDIALTLGIDDAA